MPCRRLESKENNIIVGYTWPTPGALMTVSPNTSPTTTRSFTDYGKKEDIRTQHIFTSTP
jgi:hypothetical protein